MPRPRSEVATSRLRSRADEPESQSSTRSVSSTRRAKRSQPGTAWTSSRQSVRGAVPRLAG
jgi:hypothetical protein